jgi:dihydroxyacetone kinase
MLSAAVLGNVYASPSISAILAAIRTCASPKGVLLIVKNYTGDRLNFGIALEKAKAEGIDGTIVVVDDDCALPKVMSFRSSAPSSICSSLLSSLCTDAYT